jgi:integrase
LTLKTSARKAAGTLHMYRVKAGQLQRLLGKDTALTLVDARAIDRYVHERREDGAVDNTIDKELTTLRGALKLAKRRGEYSQEIASVMPMEWSSGYKPRKTFLTEDGADALLAELPKKRAAHAAFVLATSARDSEVTRAERQDVDLRRGFVKLRGTKTEGSDRIVPVLPLTLPLLRRALRDATGRHKLFEPWSNQRRDLELFATKAKVGRYVPADGDSPERWMLSANDLRRTLATWLVQRGVEPYLVGRILGHKSSRMVERVYGVMTPTALGDLVRRRLSVHRVYTSGAKSARQAQAVQSRKR